MLEEIYIYFSAAGCHSCLSTYATLGRLVRLWWGHWKRQIPLSESSPTFCGDGGCSRLDHQILPDGHAWASWEHYRLGEAW